MTEPATTTAPAATPDFTKPREPHRFRLGGRDYAAPPILSSVALEKAAAIGQAWKGADTADLMVVVGAIAESFTVLVPGPQGQEIAERLTTEDDPIDFREEAMPCLEWLMGKYGLRPTQPSSPSSNGSPTPTGDTSSTDGASPEASASMS